MKRIAFISGVPYGSTGKIIRGIAEVANNYGSDVFVYFSWTKKYRKPSKLNENVGSFLGKSVHIVLGRLTGCAGFFSIVDTLKLIHKLKKFGPDIINIHLLHGWYINLPILFKYIQKNNINVVWTMHDCWAFTGQCPYFTMKSCDKWKTGCGNCPQLSRYPNSYFDNTSLMWRKKKELFNLPQKMTVVTPSKWLSKLVAESFLSSYPCKVINNGIDLSIFKPSSSDIKTKLGIVDKKIILGVAFDWDERKGLDIFVKLANKIDKLKYVIILVGTDENIDKNLSRDIVSIHRTQDQKELAELYSAADVFINPTREENFPTVNLEALACGTPVITFNTGGSPEMLDDSCGAVVDVDDVDGLLALIERLTINKKPVDACVNKAQNYDMNNRFYEYYELFEELD